MELDLFFTTDRQHHHFAVSLYIYCHTTYLPDMQTNCTVEAFALARVMCLSEMGEKMTFYVERRGSGRLLRGKSREFHPSYPCFQQWWIGWAGHWASRRSEIGFL